MKATEFPRSPLAPQPTEVQMCWLGQGALDHLCQYPCGWWIKALEEADMAMNRTVESKNKALVLEGSIHCSTSVTMRPPKSFGHLTTSNTALTLLPVVRACLISSRVFRQLSNMSMERLWVKGISSSCTDDFRTSASL